MVKSSGGGGRETPTKAEKFIMRFRETAKKKSGDLLNELLEGRITVLEALDGMNNFFQGACDTILNIKEEEEK